ncbi:glycoside hydrolase family 88/105 protein [Lederbergia citri]|uniref:Glycoside hydrolase family 88 protein n=1 Tax=Lederbergia citri TaxID=2833580 RepID=A0A942YI81_9BACI|nr:glycoside hydrolase family 88 protein [Lederbergia citri]MBS4195141.1 glycoside hydrolase family 88 protein [Lederbergia citri]
MISVKHQTLTSPLQWAEEACKSLMKTYKPDQLPPANRWHYHQGVFLVSMQELYEQIGDEAYYEYSKAYVDHLVDEEGNFLFNRSELDAIQAGLLLFSLHRRTGDTRYKKAADKLISMFPTFNTTKEGGFWHKDRYPYQMWLDGLYMGGVFAMNYEREFGGEGLLEMVLYQEKLMRKYTQDTETGLFYHAWDESKKQRWADPETGRAPEFWGRAIGWYGITFNEILHFLPENDPRRTELIESLEFLIEGLIRFQDDETGLWHQVVDKGEQPDNWLETSCSSLFIYTIARAMNDGHIGHQYRNHVIKAFRGLLRKMKFTEDGRFVMPDICIGTGVGDYKHYIEREKCQNDLHGVGSFVLACIQMQRLLPNLI